MNVKKPPVENYEKPFPKQLKKLMEDRKVTQTELAIAFKEKGLTVTRQTISSYANGETTPDIERFKFIADYFGVSYDYMLGESEVIERDNIDINNRTGLSDNAIEYLNKIKLGANKILDASKGVEYLFENAYKEKCKQNLYIINGILNEDRIGKMFDSILNYCDKTKFLNDKLLFLRTSKNDVEEDLIYDLAYSLCYKDLPTSHLFMSIEGLSDVSEKRKYIEDFLIEQMDYLKWSLEKKQMEFALFIAELFDLNFDFESIQNLGGVL